MTRLVFIIFCLVLGSWVGPVAATCEKVADGSCAAPKKASEVTVLLQGNMKVDEQLALESSQEVEMKVTGGDDSCQYANNGNCDEPQWCSWGTDCSDCSNCGGGGGGSSGGGSSSQTTMLGCIQQKTVGGSCNLDMSQCQTSMRTTCGNKVWTIPKDCGWDCEGLPSIWCGTCAIAGGSSNNINSSSSSRGSSSREAGRWCSSRVGLPTVACQVQSGKLSAEVP